MNFDPPPFKKPYRIECYLLPKDFKIFNIQVKHFTKACELTIPLNSGRTNWFHSKPLLKINFRTDGYLTYFNLVYLRVLYSESYIYQNNWTHVFFSIYTWRYDLQIKSGNIRIIYHNIILHKAQFNEVYFIKKFKWKLLNINYSIFFY